MEIEILLVDDHLSAAKEFSEMIKAKTKLGTIATDDPEKAIEYIKKYPIKIAILDQKMPKKNGTDLFLEIKSINPYIKAIMLTGEAAPEEVGKALTIGFSDYIHKSKIMELPPKIFYHFAQYQTDLASRCKNNGKVLLYTIKKGKLFWKHDINIELSSIELLEDKYVFPNSWETIIQINAGEKKTHTYKYEIARKIIIEEEFQDNITAKLGLSIPKSEALKLNIENQINTRFKTQTFKEDKITKEVVKEYKLSEEPTNSNEVYVKSRHYQRANVYRKIRAVLIVNCLCCNLEKYFPVTIYQLTTSIATRQDDYLSNGENKCIETGFYTLNG